MSRKATPKKKIHIVETKLGRKQCLGLWEKSSNKKTTIYLDERLRGFQRLMVAVHECLHEACPDLTEERVQQLSEFLAGFLWQCDYRHVDHAGTAQPSYKPPSSKKRKPRIKRYEAEDTKDR